jgi:NAD(P)-dependent dehydrogenase (short-subunit alcohol dehydrogenase family)
MELSPNTPAIVTGGASGLGRAVVEALRSRDVPVTVLDRDPKGTAEAADIGAGYVSVDVTDANAVGAALQKARAAQGQERICINCAAGQGPMTRPSFNR